MIPQHNMPLTVVPQRLVYPTLTYRRRELTHNSERGSSVSRITDYVDDVEAIEQAVLHILMTERRRTIIVNGQHVELGHTIYPQWYGIELDDLLILSRGFGYFRAVIEQRLNDALTVDDRIDRVTIQEVGQIDQNSAFVDFTVHTNIANISMRAEIGV